MRNHLSGTGRNSRKLITLGELVLAALSATGMLIPTRLHAQSQVYQAGKNGVGYPACSYCPDPEYSNEALKAGYEGAVVLQAMITAQGRATKIKVVKGPGLNLEDKAVEVVKRWKFKPAKGPDGNPVAVVVPIEVSFRLHH